MFVNVLIILHMYQVAQERLHTLCVRFAEK